MCLNVVSLVWTHHACQYSHLYWGSWNEGGMLSIPFLTTIPFPRILLNIQKDDNLARFSKYIFENFFLRDFCSIWPSCLNFRKFKFNCSFFGNWDIYEFQKTLSENSATLCSCFSDIILEWKVTLATQIPFPHWKITSCQVHISSLQVPLYWLPGVPLLINFFTL